MKVCLAGAGGVGKTTLLSKLISHPVIRGYEVDLCAERKILHRLNFRLGRMTPEETKIYQLALISYEMYRQLTNKDYITETPALLAKVYAKLAKVKSAALYKLCDEIMGEYDLIFYLPLLDECDETDLDDDVRPVDRAFRVDVNCRILEELKPYENRVVRLRGDSADYFRTARKTLSCL